LRQPVTGCLFSNIYAAAAGKGHAKCLWTLQDKGGKHWKKWGLFAVHF
jgi:hypothetical protein